jgi:hypothetical protein
LFQPTSLIKPEHKLPPMRLHWALCMAASQWRKTLLFATARN